MIWVDAICINQHDATEREDQVAKMFQIYDDALRVIIFLGDDIVRPIPAGTSYPTSRKLLKIQLKSVEEQSYFSENELSIDLKDILKRRYFSRVWVVQELCHGKSSPCQGVRDPLSVLIYRGFLPINLQLTRASKTAIPLRDKLVISRQALIRIDSVE
jgi:hypothetical protein